MRRGLCESRVAANNEAASFEGLDTGVLPNQIVANLHAMCTDKTYFPKLKTMNFNDNAFIGLDTALRGACDKETMGVTIRAYQVKMWYPLMCSTTDPDNYSYYDRDDAKEMGQCGFIWNWEMNEG